MGAPQFDLVICDEAHRTTGIKIEEKQNLFTRIHDTDYIKAERRLYMTATPRIYTESARQQAEEKDIGLYSMDDPKLYGKEWYRLDFSSAVGEGLLSDYKVIILTINQDYITEKYTEIAAASKDLTIDDRAKIVGCYKALRDQGRSDEGKKLKRAVSFCNTIKNSQHLQESFQNVVDALDDQENDGFTCKAKHVDGKMGSLKRGELLDWLKLDPGTNEHGDICHILSNAKCLTEGVDVPALDAVMFMQPRRSQIDVVQSVGRVMRKAPNKDYGYVILPVVIPSGITPEDALDNNDVYSVVWEVLRALRSHDDRFNAMINRLDLNQTKEPNIDVIGVGYDDDAKDGDSSTTDGVQERNQGSLPLEKWNRAIYAKLVDKVGDRRYWENWAKDIAAIHDRLVASIDSLRDQSPEVGHTFDAFYQGLKSNINDQLPEAEATSMLAQQLITRRVFDSLFKGYQFSKNNPVSQSLNTVLDQLEECGLANELAGMERFYKSVNERVENIDNLEGIQKVLIELYEKFIATAFPKVVESLGIAYTPVEIVDFILASTDHLAQQEFGRGLSDENVHIIDPFTGTGTFINRLIANNNLIADKDLERKFKNEIHANDILLLSYYIASVNIEWAYHARNQSADYESFPGIVLTDTFNMYERDERDMVERTFPENNARVNLQRKAPIRIVLGNPPWSKGQKKENDDNKNANYPKLDRNIQTHYATGSSAGRKASLYDSYVRAFRWAGDRIGDEGMVAMVTNGGWLEGGSTDGMRKSLADEFDAVWVFNLRGNARTQGEQRRKEKDNAFGQSTRALVAITLLVKNPNEPRKVADIHYCDIGDYLSRNDKLEILRNAGSIAGDNLNWQNITPNPEGDWINQRDPHFQTYMALGSKEVKQGKVQIPDTVFSIYSLGVVTNRDAWAYNFKHDTVASNMNAMIGFYNQQLESFQKSPQSNSTLDPDKFIDNDPQKISWDGTLKQDLEKGRAGTYNPQNIRPSLYRPFTKEWLYFDRQFNNSVYRMPEIFPQADSENLVIAVTGKGASEFSTFISNIIPCLDFVEKGQCFPRYIYDKTSGERIDNIPQTTLKKFHQQYADSNISRGDIFNYIYGILHAPDYRTRFASNLNKELPRIPFAENFWAFAEAGKRLAELHLDYETAPEYDLQLLVNDAPVLDPGISLTPEDYHVKKMKWANKKKPDAIAYNQRITLGGIPEQATRYIVNGRSALDWIIDRYQIKTHTDSKITNDPNHWIQEQGQPDALIQLIKRITYISVQTVDIIAKLPPSLKD